MRILYPISNTHDIMWAWPCRQKSNIVNSLWIQCTNLIQNFLHFLYQIDIVCFPLVFDWLETKKNWLCNSLYELSHLRGYCTRLDFVELTLSTHKIPQEQLPCLFSFSQFFYSRIVQHFLLASSHSILF